jgi:hypothetical protein
MKNIIQSAFNESARASIIAAVSTAEQLVATANLRPLSPEERRRYGSVNEQNKLLVNKVLDYRTSAPQLSSPDVDWTEFASDYEMRAFFESMAARLHSLASQLESGKIQHDHDNYQDALDDYTYTQYKAGVSAPGAAEKVATLKVFFSRGGAGSAATPETPANP